MARTITVFSMQDQSKLEHRTNARTWGELCRENSSIASMANGMKVTCKQTRTSLESQESLLPNEGEDLTLFLFPAKVKAGEEESQFDKIAEAYAETQSNKIVEEIEKNLLDIKEAITK